MRIKHIRLLSGLVAAYAVLPLVADPNLSGNSPQDFPRVVRYELGDSEFAPGDSITIQELHGTTEDIRTGGTYCVTGTYTMNSQDEADLSFFATTTNSISTPYDKQQQTVHIMKGTGSFRLIKRMTEEGYLHLTFYSRATGQGFGGVYFGQGQWVLRHKQWSYRDPASRLEKPNVRELVSATGPNQILFDYLGNPVPPPANLDAAYTKEGLTHAMQAAAQNAGISLLKLEIDDSEFPFLIGVAFTTKSDMQKFDGQIGKMAAYNDSGGVGDKKSRTMNLVPSSAFPEEARQRIDHRMMLREEIFYNRINGVQ
jgi:hypothetical protein